jgi:allantoicase
VAALAEKTTWMPILDRTALKGDSENRFDAREQLASHVRLNIFPDGGVARLRVLGTVTPDWTAIARAGGDVDLASLANGGLVVSCSDMFFGNMQNLILPGTSLGMHDGWETRRRRGPGHDWAVVRLGRPGLIKRVEVDTSHYKGNAPGSCSLDFSRAASTDRNPGSEADWRPLLAVTPLQPHTRHVFEDGVVADGRATHVRLNIFPDGGVARLRIFGRTDG